MFSLHSNDKFISNIDINLDLENISDLYYKRRVHTQACASIDSRSLYRSLSAYFVEFAVRNEAAVVHAIATFVN